MPNAALAMYNDALSARKALDASPIRFCLETVFEDEVDLGEEGKKEGAGAASYVQAEAGKKDGVEEITRPSTLLHRPSGNSTWGQFTTAMEQPAKETATGKPEVKTPKAAVPALRKQADRWFHLTIDRSHVVHQDYVSRQPLYHEFHPQKTMEQEDLAKSVPHVGLSDVGDVVKVQARVPNSVILGRAMNLNMRTTLREMMEDGKGGKNESKREAKWNELRKVMNSEIEQTRAKRKELKERRLGLGQLGGNAPSQRKTKRIGWDELPGLKEGEN